MQHTMKHNNITAISDSAGGELISFSVGDLQYLWNGNPAFWSGHSPVLFPIVCALKNNEVTIDGSPYTMAKHGFARKREFQVREADDTHITYRLCDDEETLKGYPFHFRLEVTHRLLPQGFETEYAVTNTGEADMPFCIGGHPGFSCPLREGEEFQDYRLVFEKPEEPQALCPDEDAILNRHLYRPLNFTDPRTLPLRYEDYKDDALIFDQPNSRKVSLLNGSRGLEFSFEDFPVLGVWTPAGKQAPFICLEPWLGLPALSDEDGRFENKPYAVTLPSGQTRTACYRMRVID